MSSTNTYTQEERKVLLAIASQSIGYGLSYQQPIGVQVEALPATLQAHRAAFVTLEIHKKLRGCIGSLQAYRPLGVDVAQNAFSAAFKDPRFSPLTQEEYPAVEIHVSVLSSPEPMSFSSESDLLQKIRPGIDGLILEDQGRRGTFLPSVWEGIPKSEDFLRHLKNKAGLPMDYWSPALKIYRYTTESFGAESC